MLCRNQNYNKQPSISRVLGAQIKKVVQDLKRIIIALIVMMVLAGTSCKTVSSGSDASAAISPTEQASESPESTTPNPSQTAVTPPADKETILLEGTIGDLPVHMRLKIKNGKVSGSYSYDKVKQDIMLEGSIEADRMMYINEFDEVGDMTGQFDGWYTPGIRITGRWTDTKTDKVLDFNLAIIDGVPADAIWAGEWKRMDTGRFYSATLVIFQETENSFEFLMDAYSGANMGFIGGTATLEGTKAYYKDSGTEGAYPPGAALTFELKDGQISLTANEAANGQAGAGVVFDGAYTKAALPEDTLLRMHYVQSEEQDEAFRTMVGKDYELFLNTANFPEDAEDLDNLGADVTTWWVRGFTGSNESIVMLLPDGRLCAAVIEPESGTIKVYTDADYITAVPKTIKTWADSFPEMAVQFHNTNKN